MVTFWAHQSDGFIDKCRKLASTMKPNFRRAGGQRGTQFAASSLSLHRSTASVHLPLLHLTRDDAVAS